MKKVLRIIFLLRKKEFQTWRISETVSNPLAMNLIEVIYSFFGFVKCFEILFLRLSSLPFFGRFTEKLYSGLSSNSTYMRHGNHSEDRISRMILYFHCSFNDLRSGITRIIYAITQLWNTYVSNYFYQSEILGWPLNFIRHLWLRKNHLKMAECWTLHRLRWKNQNNREMFSWVDFSSMM